MRKYILFQFFDPQFRISFQLNIILIIFIIKNAHHFRAVFLTGYGTVIFKVQKSLMQSIFQYLRTITDVVYTNKGARARDMSWMVCTVSTFHSNYVEGFICQILFVFFEKIYIKQSLRRVFFRIVGQVGGSSLKPIDDCFSNGIVNGYRKTRKSSGQIRIEFAIQKFPHLVCNNFHADHHSGLVVGIGYNNCIGIGYNNCIGIVTTDKIIGHYAALIQLALSFLLTILVDVTVGALLARFNVSIFVNRFGNGYRLGHNLSFELLE